MKKAHCLGVDCGLVLAVEGADPYQHTLAQGLLQPKPLQKYWSKAETQPDTPSMVFVTRMQG
jgi:hypothetical protein